MGVLRVSSHVSLLHRGGCPLESNLGSSVCVFGIRKQHGISNLNAACICNKQSFITGTLEGLSSNTHGFFYANEMTMTNDDVFTEDDGRY